MKLITAVAHAKRELRPETYSTVQAYITAHYPATMRALKAVDAEEFTPRQPKGYNLVKREDKRLGFVYYVRYRHGGKMLSSKWNTRTNDRAEAERFARKNRVRLVGGYLKKHGGACDYTPLEKFFERGSEYLTGEEKRSGTLAEERRRRYCATMTGRFVPFLKVKGIGHYEHVTTQVLDDFQDWCLAQGKKPQTVNDYFKPIRKVFAYFKRKGKIERDPCVGLKNVPVKESDKGTHGCYEIEKLKGVFNAAWEDGRSYILNLIIHTTGMRNGEIEKVKAEDIIEIGGVHFIDVKKSKTANGERLVPLHEFAYKKLLAFAGETPAGQPLIKRSNKQYEKATAVLGERLGVSGEERQRQHITFYSGRHFWKTLMNAGGLGDDIEEIFMGHKVSGNVAKLYNHQDKQGQTRMLKKARLAFKILDKYLF